MKKNLLFRIFVVIIICFIIGTEFRMYVDLPSLVIDLIIGISLSAIFRLYIKTDKYFLYGNSFLIAGLMYFIVKLTIFKLGVYKVEVDALVLLGIFLLPVLYGLIIDSLVYFLFDSRK